MLFLLFFLGEHYTTFSRPEAQDFQQQRLSVLTFFWRKCSITDYGTQDHSKGTSYEVHARSLRLFTSGSRNRSEKRCGNVTALPCGVSTTAIVFAPTDENDSTASGEISR